MFYLGWFKSQVSANYIQLPNVEAYVERWKGVGIWGKNMKAQGVNKDSSCRMIEVDDTLHEFSF